MGRGAGLGLHHHAGISAHDGGRCLVQNRPALLGDFRHVTRFIHFGKEHKAGGISSVERKAVVCVQGGKACARCRLVRAPDGAPRDRDVEALSDKPCEAFERRGPGARSAQILVVALTIAIERDTKREPARMRGMECRKRGLHMLHRLHGIGEDEDAETCGERVVGHADHVGVHKGLAAGEADFGGRMGETCGFVEKSADLGAAEINERVIARARFDVAITAGEIAKRAGVEPERVEARKRHMGARRPVRRDGRIGEFQDCVRLVDIHDMPLRHILRTKPRNGFRRSPPK